MSDLLTMSDDPEREFPSRYPRADSNGDVAMRWADRQYPDGYSSSMSFSGGTVRSYATPIARRVRSVKTGDVAILISARTYSKTTAGKHLPPVRRAARMTNLPVFTVYDVTADTLDAHHTNAAALYDVFTETVKKGNRTRKYAEFYAREAREAAQQLMAYCAFVGLDLYPDPSMPFDIFLDWLEEHGNEKLAQDARKLCAAVAG